MVRFVLASGSGQEGEHILYGYFCKADSHPCHRSGTTLKIYVYPKLTGHFRT